LRKRTSQNGVLCLLCSALCLVCAVFFVLAENIQAQQTVTVTGIVSVVRETAGAGKLDSNNAVVWLKAGSLNRNSVDRSSPRLHFRILQQHKHFDPHVLAVPVGSVIDFPNLDPFFHNVFSMFNGKRFDLGLYEAGGSHSVTFDAPGICYIFCNIHPEMSAAVVVIDSPYFATSNRAGQFSIPNVAPGNYLLNVWHERGKTESARDFPRPVTISAENASLGVIRLVDAGELLANHKNKYGRDYEIPANPIYK
jgi:plastocyanin